jgi:hypothetical protein
MGSVSERPAFDADARCAPPVNTESFLIAPAGAVESGEFS